MNVPPVPSSTPKNTTRSLSAVVVTAAKVTVALLLLLTVFAPSTSTVETVLMPLYPATRAMMPVVPEYVTVGAPSPPPAILRKACWRTVPPAPEASVPGSMAVQPDIVALIDASFVATTQTRRSPSAVPAGRPGETLPPVVEGATAPTSRNAQDMGATYWSSSSIVNSILSPAASTIPVKSPLTISGVPPLGGLPDPAPWKTPAFVIVLAPSAVMSASHRTLSATGCERVAWTRASVAGVNKSVSPFAAVPAPVPHPTWSASLAVPPSIRSTTNSSPACVNTVAIYSPFRSGAPPGAPVLRTSVARGGKRNESGPRVGLRWTVSPSVLPARWTRAVNLALRPCARTTIEPSGRATRKRATRSRKNFPSIPDLLPVRLDVVERDAAAPDGDEPQSLLVRWRTRAGEPLLDRRTRHVELFREPRRAVRIDETPEPRRTSTAARPRHAVILSERRASVKHGSSDTDDRPVVAGPRVIAGLRSRERVDVVFRREQLHAQLRVDPSRLRQLYRLRERVRRRPERDDLDVEQDVELVVDLHDDDGVGFPRTVRAGVLERPRKQAIPLEPREVEVPRESRRVVESADLDFGRDVRLSGTQVLAIEIPEPVHRQRRRRDDHRGGEGEAEHAERVVREELGRRGEVREPAAVLVREQIDDPCPDGEHPDPRPRRDYARRRVRAAPGEPGERHRPIPVVDHVAGRHELARAERDVEEELPDGELRLAHPPDDPPGDPRP